jgi:2-C-methyl-D-erythritol 4-phosphate cytidylyltransferase
MNGAILLAGGRSQRMQGAVDDKILAHLAGKPAFEYSLEAFASTELFGCICIVYRDAAQQAALLSIAQKFEDESLRFAWASGGAARQDSVMNGLRALSKNTRIVHIHDCARPLISTGSIQRVHAAAEKDGAAVLAHRVTDTIKRASSAEQTESVRLEDLERPRLWACETPQTFHYRDILQAYQRVQAEGLQITDDIAAVSKLGKRATLVENTEPNLKITTAADLDYLEWLLKK